MFKMQTIRLPVAAMLVLSLLSVVSLAGDRGGSGEKWKQADADGDGLISQQEFEAVGRGNFSDWDGDGDGYLNQAEREAAREKMRQKFRERQRNFGS